MVLRQDTQNSVRSPGQSGKHMLDPSITDFDPKRTLPVGHARTYAGDLALSESSHDPIRARTLPLRTQLWLMTTFGIA
jgi:hypothetical protein